MKIVLWNGMSKMDLAELRKKDDFSISGTKIQKKQRIFTVTDRCIFILTMSEKYIKTQFL